MDHYPSLMNKYPPLTYNYPSLMNKYYLISYYVLQYAEKTFSTLKMILFQLTTCIIF